MSNIVFLHDTFTAIFKHRAVAMGNQDSYCTVDEIGSDAI